MRKLTAHCATLRVTHEGELAFLIPVYGFRKVIGIDVHLLQLVTSEDIEGHEAATTRGMAEGAAAGLTFAGISHFFLRSKPYYRSLPVTIKFLGVVLCVAPAIAAQAERRGVQYDMEHNW